MNKVLSFPRAALLAAAVLLGLGSIPALSDDGPPAPETLRLHMGTDGTFFEYSNNGTPTQQAIGTPRNCRITVDGQLASLTGSDRGPGLVDNAIGISTGGAQGVPCSRVDPTEDLTLALGAVPDAAQVSLDLELKGDVNLAMDLSRGGTAVGTFYVRAGGGIVAGEGVDGSMTAPYTATVTDTAPIANCRNASDSGPDSGANDNCYLTIVPSASFDTVKFRPVSGAISLEGGGDYGNNAASFETVFTLVGYDGELGCDETNNSVSIEEGTVFGEITRLENTDGSACVLKPYNIAVDSAAGTLSFVPEDNEGAPQAAAYQGVLMFAPELAANPFQSHLEYDQDDDGPLGFEDMPWCAGDPFDTPDAPGSINTEVISAGDTWCVVSATTSIVSETETRTTWVVVGIGDPKFR